MHGTIYPTVQRYFLTTYGRSDSVLSSRDSAETVGGWAGSLAPWALARGGSRQDQNGEGREGGRLSQCSPLSFLPGITLTSGGLTFRTGSGPLLPTYSRPPLFAVFHLNQWSCLAPAMVTQSKSKCKQGGLSAHDLA